MQEEIYYIVLNIKTCTGFESFAKFSIGHSREFASALFQKLRGRQSVDEKSLLQIDLMEMSKGLPFNLQMLSCSLEELAENCRIITKEIFKTFTLKGLE